MSDDPDDRSDADPLDDRLGADATNDGDTEDHDADDDPFERIGEGSGPRHGDPFDAFEGARPPEEAPADESTAEEDRPDPARQGLPSGITDEDDRRGAADADADDPFTEFDEPTTDPFAEGDSVFEGAVAGEGDDGVWERMESTDAEAEAVPGKRYVDVNKHSYCETCEYFSAPPAISCSHEGTEILEFVDMDTVRVVDCPVVAERKAIEDGE